MARPSFGVVSFFSVMAMFVAAAAAQAVQPDVQLLWPDGAPGALGKEPKDQPRLFCYRTMRDRNDTATRMQPAVIVCPGGGYGGLAMEHEGRDIAYWLNAQGIQAYVLDYRHRGKGYGHPAPLLDVQRAVRVVRARAVADELDARWIGVIGFSAGGHLAASISVHHDAGDPMAKDPIDRLSCRPDFAVLCYPVIAFGRDYTHRGSQQNLLGKDAAAELVEFMSCERQVTATTPPTFLWHTNDDEVVPVQNSLVYCEALRSKGVPVELHVFERGAHGLGLAVGQPTSTWPELLRHWFEVRGMLATKR